MEENPSIIKQGDGATVIMVPTKPMTCDSFHEFPPLGRFAIRDNKKTIGVGIIKEVMRRKLPGKEAAAAPASHP